MRATDPPYNTGSDFIYEDDFSQRPADYGNNSGQTEIARKKVLCVADGYLIACFDRDVTEGVVTAIAKQHPFYALFRDRSMANDSVAVNFEQIFLSSAE